MPKLTQKADISNEYSNIQNWHKRTAFLYGDGAGAVVISQQHQNQLNQFNKQHQPDFIASHLYADGSGHDAVFVPSVGSAASSGQTTATLTMPKCLGYY